MKFNEEYKGYKICMLNCPTLLRNISDNGDMHVFIDQKFQNDLLNIVAEGNISKMPDFDVFCRLEFRKRKSRSQGLRQKGNNKRKMRDTEDTVTIEIIHCMMLRY